MFINSISKNTYFKVESYIVFIFLFQYFFYIKDLPNFYYLQKLLLPLILSIITIFILIKKNNKSEKRIFYIFLSYIFILVSSSLGSTYYFNQPLIYSIIAEGKLLAAASIFLGYYYIKKRSVSEKELLHILMVLFWITISLYIYFQYAIDPSKYWHQDSQIFILDSKGFRIKLPVQLITLVSFYALANLEKNKINIVIYVITLWYLINFHDQRFYLFVFILISLIILVVRYFQKYWKSLFFLAIPITLLSLFQLSDIVNYLSNVDSISIRGNRFFVIEDFLHKGNLLNYFLGAGEINENWKLKEFLFRTRFSSSDFGVIGIFYEFGIFGIIFFFVFYAYILMKITKIKDGVLQGFKYFFIFSFFLSLLSPYLFYYAGLLCGMVGIMENYLTQNDRTNKTDPNSDFKQG